MRCGSSLADDDVVLLEKLLVVLEEVTNCAMLGDVVLVLLAVRRALADEFDHRLGEDLLGIHLGEGLLGLVDALLGLLLLLAFLLKP